MAGGRWQVMAETRKNSQFSILNSQFPIPHSQFSILSSQFSIPQGYSIRFLSMIN
ncbi:MAG: hypothetical protein F6K31_30325 [Symploca sp. SIO2G7]|nr:hypothetical protein [Symploca sp. SIO2G7]